MRKPFQIENAPHVELNRSTAARRIGDAAAASGLFLTHFESRYHIDPPEAWLPEDRPDLAGSAYWTRGQRIEPKYAYFRYDSPLGSFHPSHRAKWTAHELCHGLVGFAWRPNQSRFFHHAAARLSEVVPVALWYFFDEVDVHRCELHKEKGLLFGDHCTACELSAQQPAREVDSPALTEKGKAFVQQEIDAVFRSIASGHLFENRYATLNLSRDGAAWANAHFGRLNAPSYAWFRERFLTTNQGYFQSLEDLRDRAWMVTEMLAGNRALVPWEATPALWRAHDIADRLFTIHQQCEAEVQAPLEVLIEMLSQSDTMETLDSVIEGYEDLHSAYYLPEPSACFGVGYKLSNDYGHHSETVIEGLKSACPETTRKLGEKLLTIVPQFLGSTRPERRGIGIRFADYMDQNSEPFMRDLATYEAHMAHPKPIDFVTEHFAKKTYTSLRIFEASHDVEVVQLSHDIHGFMNGQCDENNALKELSVWLALRPTPSQDMLVVELTKEDAQILRDGIATRKPIAAASISQEALQSLLTLGFLRSTRQLCTLSEGPKSLGGTP